MDSATLQYERGTLSVAEIQSEIDEFLAEQARSDQRGSGSSDIGAADVDGAIKVSAGSSGADPLSVILIVAFAPTANEMLKNVWHTAILPRIRRRWGEDAIGREKSGSEK